MNVIHQYFTQILQSSYMLNAKFTKVSLAKMLKD